MRRPLPLLLALLLPACDLGVVEHDVGPDAGVAEIEAAPSRAGEVRLMTYNIRHAADATLATLGTVIAGQAPDVVCLQEVDFYAARSGDVHQAEILGQLTGLRHAFRRAIQLRDGGRYGVAVLSRFPFQHIERVSLTSRGEQRVALVASIDLPAGNSLQVVCTHLGLNAGERLTQARELTERFGDDAQTALLADWNETPAGGAFAILESAFDDAWLRGAGWTIPAWFPTRRYDAIFLSADFPRPRESHVVGHWTARWASDHRPVVTTVALP